MAKKLQSRAELLLEPFREENLSKWTAYSIEDFLGVIIHELAREEQHIEGWVALIRKNNPNLDQVIVLSKGEDVITFDDLLDKFLSSSEIINGLWKCINSYLKASRNLDGTPEI